MVYSCMKVAKSEHPKKFLIWPAKEVFTAIKQKYVLPICPVVVLAKSPSTRRKLIYSIDNAEIIDEVFQIDVQFIIVLSHWEVFDPHVNYKVSIFGLHTHHPPTPTGRLS